MSDTGTEISQQVVSAYSKWWTIIKNMVFHTKGEGASSTKGAYLVAAITVATCLFMLTMTFCWVYWRWHVVDAIFAGAIAAMTVSLIGFASRSQNVKTKTTIQGATNEVSESSDK